MVVIDTRNTVVSYSLVMNSTSLSVTVREL